MNHMYWCINLALAALLSPAHLSTTAIADLLSVSYLHYHISQIYRRSNVLPESLISLFHSDIQFSEAGPHYLKCYNQAITILGPL